MWAVDISCLPFIYALLFRKTKTWRSFLIASAVMCVVFCFALEPLFVWADVYRPLTWKSWYGLPLYFAIGAASKFITSLAFRPAAEKGKA